MLKKRIIPVLLMRDGKMVKGKNFRNFRDITGSRGGFQREFKVYQLEGRKCKNYRCSGLIKKKITFDIIKPL